MKWQKKRLNSAILPILGAVTISCQIPAAATESEPELSSPYHSTPTSDVESSNPIKLRVVENAPSSSLPEMTGALGLDDAIKAGIKNNLTLRQSEQNWIGSKFLAKAELAKFGPSASFHTWYSASSLNQMLFDPYSTTVLPETMQPIAKGSLLSVLFVGSQPLFTGGRLMGGYKAARAREHQSLASYQEERIATALKIKEAYWNAAWAEAQLRVNSDYARYREWSTRNMKERYLDGKAPKADYLREEAELARAKEQVNDSYRDFNSALLNLKVALAVNLGSNISLKDGLEYVETRGDVSTYLIDAAKNRPELARAIGKVAEMKANKVVARSKYMPQIGLYGLGSNLTGNSPDGSASGKWGGLIGVMGGITLFDSGNRLNELRATSAAVRAAELEKNNTELKVGQDVCQAWIDLDLARRNVELAKSQVISAEEDQRLFHARYEVGKAIALEDFDAAVKLFQARLAEREAIYKYLVAQARLIFASGSM
jgi:outer membrane protein